MFILIETDASIKTLHNIKIDMTDKYHSGYSLIGTLINGSFATNISIDGFIQLVQMNGVVYILRMDTDSSGDFFTSKESGIIYTLLYY